MFVLLVRVSLSLVIFLYHTFTGSSELMVTVVSYYTGLKIVNAV